MPDFIRRQLERQSAGGDLQAREKLLLERRRSQEVSEDQLRLAAYLGDQAARNVLEMKEVREPESLENWLQGLRQFGEGLLVRVAILLARFAIMDLNETPLPKSQQVNAIDLEQYLTLVEQSFFDPSEENISQLRELEGRVDAFLEEEWAVIADMGAGGSEAERRTLMIQAASNELLLASQDERDEGEMFVGSGFENFAYLFGGRMKLGHNEMVESARRIISTQLIEWSLDGKDPIREDLDGRDAEQE